MYPMLKEGVSVGTFNHEDSETTRYYMENADGDTFEISRRLCDALLDADGTKPLDLPDKGRSILPALKKRGIVRTSRFVRDEGIFNRFILFPISNKLQNGSLACRAINAALPVVSVLIFAIGVYRMLSGNVKIGGDFNWWIYYGFFTASLALHEAGHLIAGLACRYIISDTGILLLGILPIGAYVAYEEREDAAKLEKIQFSLAGIEVNLLLAGVCLLAAMQYEPLSFTLLSTAWVNVILAGLNLLPVSGLDGEAALSALCGVNSISETAKKWLFNKKRRKKLLHSGLPGYARLCGFALIFLSKILLWLFIGFEVVSAFFAVILP